MIRHLDTPPGDDRLSWRGVVTLPSPFVPPLDPVIRGVRVVLYDGTGAVFTDATIPPGAYDPLTKTGWVVGVSGRVFIYKTGKQTPLIGGIRKVVVKDYSSREPGRVKFAVKGRNGSFAVAVLPVRATLVLDSPVAASGQCAEHTFPGPAPAPSCTSPISDLVVCR